ncbi:phosphatase PAP2 family protein [Spirosoma linguale]|uniref:Phosphoesterase PA-phosphatase related protein n=1 Tax=Spirosoma linguale (strain ATCC 33905 / DSM 74 / LMG 10896 / Claus 1) TaxID=504472 RepID=D2QW10_SPILD|nr:phosphoesterase PA-phosphatase related protein [Spirosoma linguale DSM 74]MBR8840678.1 phosphatase PAP2 family protein [Stigonema ocellatum SAG 48.90 = DSM 106950]
MNLIFHRTWLTFKKQRTVLLALISYQASLILSFGQSPYELKTDRELTLLGVGALTGITSLVLEQQVKPWTPSEIALLNRNTINPFDRSATYKFNSTANQISDMTLLGTAAVTGLLVIATKPMRQDIKTLGIMYLETLLVVNGVQYSVKNITQRTRPYGYNPAVAVAEKLDRNTKQSFFSGHAANAFATAVFTGEVFQQYFPYSRLKSVVWVGSLGLATVTSVLRYEGGKHYPSDLLVGTAFGSLVGWGIPYLHMVKNHDNLSRRLDVRPWSNGSANGVYVQLRVFSR